MANLQVASGKSLNLGYEDSVKRNNEALAPLEVPRNIKTYSIPGDHATSWATVKTIQVRLNTKIFEREIKFWCDIWDKERGENPMNPFEQFKKDFPKKLAVYLYANPNGWTSAENFNNWVDRSVKKLLPEENCGISNCRAIGKLIAKMAVKSFIFYPGCEQMDDFLETIHLKGNIFC